MSLSNDEVKQYAKIMLDQLTYGHPNALKVMLGTKNLYAFPFEYNGYEQPSFVFDFKMSRKYKYCRIILDLGADTYIMQFLDRNYNLKHEIKDVFFDELNPRFSEVTGLTLIMPNIIGF